MQSVEYIDFQQYLLAIKRRWRLATVTFGFVVVTTGAYTLLQKPIYQATGKILIRQPSSVSSALNAGSEKKDLSSVGSQSDPLGTEIELIRSTAIAQKATEKLNRAIPTHEFLDNLNVTKLDRADILEISYQSTNPEEAAASVNQVINLYLDSDISSYRSEAAATRQFILRQLPQNASVVRQAAMKLRRFEEKNNIVNLDEEAKSAVKAISSLEEQINTSQAKLADVISQLDILRKTFQGWMLKRLWLQVLLVNRLEFKER
jgi:polysaccharide biosynthesis transport protein